MDTSELNIPEQWTYQAVSRGVWCGPIVDVDSCGSVSQQVRNLRATPQPHTPNLHIYDHIYRYAKKVRRRYQFL